MSEAGGAHGHIPVFVRVAGQERAVGGEHTDVEPGLGQRRRAVNAAVDKHAVGIHSPVLDLFGVGLLDHAEATELALGDVEAAVVISVLTYRPGTGDEIGSVDARHALHREGKTRAPRVPIALVLQPKRRRGAVGDCDARAEVVGIAADGACGQPSRSTKRKGASVGRVDDHTKQVVPLPSRSVVDRSTAVVAANGVETPRAALQPLPQRFNQAVQPSLPTYTRSVAPYR